MLYFRQKVVFVHICITSHDFVIRVQIGPSCGKNILSVLLCRLQLSKDGKYKKN